VASFEGLTLSGYWLHRNLLGGAERLRFDGSITNIGARDSGVDYRLGVTVDRPATFTPDTTLILKSALGHIDDVDEQYDDFDISLGVSHAFSDTLTARFALAFEWSQGNDPRRPFLYRNVSFPLGVNWDRRDSTVNATKGFYLDAEIKPFLGYDTTGSGARLQLDARAYRGFGAQGGMVLAGRLQAGAVYGSDLLETPRDYLFYSGGGGTVRGQPYQSLGVDVLSCLACDSKTGGAFFLGGSVEARVKLTDRIGVVGFFDYGSVGLQDFLDIDNNWHSGAGLGLRYDTGFGPIRLDIAAPVGGDTGNGVQIYVGLGQAF
jgi:translocation and assembly module TamA